MNWPYAGRAALSRFAKRFCSSIFEARLNGAKHDQRTFVFMALVLMAVSNRMDGKQDTRPVVNVYVQINTSVPVVTLAGAQGIASEIFATAGVRIHWTLGEPKTDESNQPILIEILSDVPERFHPGALAYANSFEGVHIQIFYDRLENGESGSGPTMLLAHVLVHEITHLLEGTNHHSEHGVMKARWSSYDLARMVYESLPFDPEDVRLIRRGLATRPMPRRPHGQLFGDR
jgi:hypothetical protein